VKIIRGDNHVIEVKCRVLLKFVKDSEDKRECSVKPFSKVPLKVN